jgi:hypothetical protein
MALIGGLTGVLAEKQLAIAMMATPLAPSFSSEWLTAGAVLLLFSIPLGLAGRFGCGFRLRHLLNSLRYPSHVVAVSGGLVLFSVLQSSGAGREYPLLLHLLTIAIYPVSVLIADLLTWVLRAERSIAESEEFNRWLSTDEPIDRPEQDRLGMKRLCDQMRERLLNPMRAKIPKEPGYSLGIVGPFGTGKSSLARLLASELEANQEATQLAKFVCVQSSFWGFASAGKAEEHILRSVIAELSKHVDCLSLRSLPASFARSVSTGHSWLDYVMGYLTSLMMAGTQLERLEPVLRAMNMHVVLVLEDIDRTDQDFRRDQVYAFVWRLRQVPGVSTVLTANCSQIRVEGAQGVAGAFDLKKLCEYSYDISIRDDAAFLFVLKQLNLVRQQMQKTLLAAYDRKLFGTPVDAWSVSVSTDGSKTWLGHVVAMCDSVREFKSVLRRVWSAWESLAGEVNFDDLIIASTFRETCPDAFRLVRELLPHCQEQGQGADRRRVSRDSVNDEWIRTTIDSRVPLDRAKRKSVEVLLALLLPKTRRSMGMDEDHHAWRSHTAQSVCFREPTDYWRRIVSEHIGADEIRDQDVLKAITEWDSDPGASKALAATLLQNGAWGRKLLQFRKGWGADVVTALTSDYLSMLCENQGPEATGKEAALLALRDIVAPRFMEQRPTQDWLRAEIRRALPVSLRLAIELFREWTAWPGNGGHLLDKDRGALLESLVEGARDTYGLAQGGAALVESTRLDDFSVLRDLVSLRGCLKCVTDANSGPYEMDFLRAPVLEALEKHPQHMTPKVVYLIGREHGPRPSATYKFNDSTVSQVFSGTTVKLMELLAREPVFAEDADQFVGLDVADAQAGAKAWLARHGSAE